jgi:hypothetical protein
MINWRKPTISEKETIHGLNMQKPRVWGFLVQSHGGERIPAATPSPHLLNTNTFFPPKQLRERYI